MSATRVTLIKKYTSDTGKVFLPGRELFVDKIKAATLIKDGYVAGIDVAVELSTEEGQNKTKKTINKI